MGYFLLQHLVTLMVFMLLRKVFHSDVDVSNGDVVALLVAVVAI